MDCGSNYLFNEKNYQSLAAKANAYVPLQVQITIYSLLITPLVSSTSFFIYVID
jgi:hypothetical protein